MSGNGIGEMKIQRFAVDPTVELINEEFQKINKFIDVDVQWSKTRVFASFFLIWQYRTYRSTDPLE